MIAWIIIILLLRRYFTNNYADSYNGYDSFLVWLILPEVPKIMLYSLQYFKVSIYY